MNWKASPPALETAFESIAALCLGGAVTFAVAQVAPLAGAGVAGAAAFFGARLAMRAVDRRPRARGAVFVPGDLVAAERAVEDVLLLDQPVDGALLLDEPLPAIHDDMRVVQLFAAQPEFADGAARPFDGPGEMVARIEDFLGSARGGGVARPARPVGDAPAQDASAALHAALADIRRSLRQG